MFPSKRYHMNEEEGNGGGRSGLVNGCVKSLPSHMQPNVKNGTRIGKFKAALARQQERL